MAKPKVSVVIPAYNGEDYIAEAVTTSAEQDYEPLEVIVSDDGSTDGTPDIVRDLAGRYPERVRPVLAQRNRGIASAFNQALTALDGELIAWLGGDDVMLPGKIAKQVSRLAERPDAVACVHDAEVFESSTGRVYGRFSQLNNGRRGLLEGGVELLFHPTYLMLPSATMVRRSACPPGGFDERLQIANDWLFDVAVFRNGRCVVVDEVLSRYRRHGGNITARPGGEARSFEEALTALTVAQARYPELSRLARRRRAALMLGRAYRLARGGRSGTAARLVSAAVGEAGVAGVGATGFHLARVLNDRRRLRLPHRW